MHLFAFLLLLLSAVSSAAPSTEPILRPNLTMHSAMITRIDIDAKEQFAVSASFDKTVRVWRLPSLDLVQVLHPPIGEWDEGQLYAVAISPDGHVIATGGSTGYQWDKKMSIYLFDRATGKLATRITDLPTRISHLAFSADGRYLAAALGEGGIRIYQLSTATPRLVAEDRDYGASSYWVEFDRSGRLVSSCLDGYLRLYDSRFKLIQKQTVSGGKQPYSVRFHPDGTRLAVGFNDSMVITLVSGQDLTFLEHLDIKDILWGLNSNLSNLMYTTWSSTGLTLLTGGRYRVRGGENPILRWQKDSKPQTSQIAAFDTIYDLRSLTANRLLVASNNPALILLDEQGKQLANRDRELADFRGLLLNNLGITEDGSQVSFTYDSYGKSSASFSVKEFSFTDKSNIAFHFPHTKSNNLNIENWKNKTPYTLSQYRESRSFAISNNEQYVLFGTDRGLSYVDVQGKIIWRKPVASPYTPTWAVNLSVNGLVAVAAFDDGTIRWYRVSDGEELLAFFPHADKKRWVVWTPQGYYAASGGGESLVGWHVNKGADKAADFFEIGQFRDTYYRPDVIAKVLITLDVTQALAEANQQRGKQGSIARAADNISKAPFIKILSPSTGSTFKDINVTLRYAVTQATGTRVNRITLLVDGRPHQAITPSNSTQKQWEAEAQVTLPARESLKLTLLAENDYATSKDDATEASIELRWEGGKESLKPNMYVLAIGVQKYDESDLNTLKYPVKDAQDLVNVLKKQQYKLYNRVETRLLKNPTKDEILDDLNWLEKQVTHNDVAIVFISGHGKLNNKQNYYFLPQDAKLDNLKRSALSYGEIKDTITGLAGKRLFFADTCHAGAVLDNREKGSSVDMNAIITDLTSAQNGVIVLSATTGLQIALEKDEWGNGAFTKALIEALEGAADLIVDNGITLKEIDTYISQRVKTLTKGQQTPTVTIPSQMRDFPLVLKPN